jgi:hypothetical protein
MITYSEVKVHLHMFLTSTLYVDERVILKRHTNPFYTCLFFLKVKLKENLSLCLTKYHAVKAYPFPN